MMAMMAAGRQQPKKWSATKQKRSTATTNDLMQRRFLNARLGLANEHQTAQQEVVLEDADSLLQQLMLMTPTERQIDNKNRYNDWRSLLKLITGTAIEDKMMAKKSVDEERDETDNIDENSASSSTSFDRPRRRLVINSSNGARLYVDPRRGIDWPSDEEAIERGLRLPDSHPRRAPRPQGTGSKATSGNSRPRGGQPSSSYYYHQSPTWLKAETEEISSTTTTTTASPSFLNSGSSYRGTSGGNGLGKNGFNRSASSFSVASSGKSQNFASSGSGRRFADSYYDSPNSVQHSQFGHRYYEANAPTTTSSPQVLKPVRNGSSSGNSRNRNGNGSGLGVQPNQSNSWNRNQPAHLYRTNRTAWEIEYRKYQEFVADAMQKGHVYGKVNRTNRAAGGDNKLYDVPQVGKLRKMFILF